MILVITVAFLFSFLPSVEFLLNFSNDDSFFYLKTAYNFSIGQGSTFDLINKTNGYHPFWFMILAVYFFIMNFFTVFTPELYFRLTVLMINLINSASLYFLFLYFKNTNPSRSGKLFALSAPLFLTLVAIRDFGMETHLSCLLIILYLFIKSKEIRESNNFYLYKYLILIFLFLTRIDYILNVIPVIIFSDYMTSGKEKSFKFPAVSLSLLMITAFLYFMTNYFFFGNFMTITTVIKSSFPQNIFIKNFNDLFAPGTFTNQFVKSFFVLLTVSVFMILILNGNVRRKFDMNDYFLFGVCFSTLVFIVFNLFFNWFTLKEWYVAFPAFVCSVLMVRLISLVPGIQNLSLVIFISVLLIYFTVTRINNSKWDSMYYFALGIKQNTAEDDRIFMIDLSGIAGYFSERKIINGDGLVNSFEYWKYRNSDNLSEYFKKTGVNYYASYSTSKGNHEMRDSSGYYIDKCYSNKFGGYSFTFPHEQLIYKAPYYYFHAVNSDKGFWYLFKLK